MSIPSFIGILHTDRTLELISCKYDGYPTRGVGFILIKNFNSFEDAQKIVSQGNRNCLLASKKHKIIFTEDPIFKFENWDYFVNYLKDNNHNIFVYIWNEIVERWEFIEGTEIKNIHNFKNLSTFLGKK
jgi:hypothetical protein